MRDLLNKPWVSFAYITILVLLMNLKGVDSFVESLGWIAIGAAIYFALSCVVWHFNRKDGSHKVPYLVHGKDNKY